MLLQPGNDGRSIKAAGIRQNYFFICHGNASSLNQAFVSPALLRVRLLFAFHTIQHMQLLFNSKSVYFFMNMWIFGTLT
jgi:hypothetical protein